MRSKVSITSRNSISNFDLSISDLMATLCLILLVYLAITTQQLQGIAGNYDSKQKKLKQEIEKEFEVDFAGDKWNAYIDDDLTIHFNDTAVLFEAEKSDVSERFIEILDDLFPRLISIVTRDDFKDEILEIRIEGHTATKKYDRKTQKFVMREDSYKDGMDVSQLRTTKVLFQCLENPKFNNETVDGVEIHEWLRKHLVAINYSDSKPVFYEGTEKEDPDASRRVEIRIRTKAEEALKDIKNLKFGKVLYE